MDILKLHHHAHEDNLDEIKFALLYFEKVEIPIFRTQLLRPIPHSTKLVCISENNSATQSYLDHIKVLEDEGVLVVDNIDYNHSFRYQPEINLAKIPNGIGNIVGNNLHKFFKNAKVKTDTVDGTDLIEYDGDLIDELEHLSNRLKQSTGKFRIYSEHFETFYVIAQIESILSDINLGKSCMNTSPLIDSFIKDFFNSSHFKTLQSNVRRFSNIETHISQEVLKLNLPNAAKLSFEDILEIRSTMKDELEAFRYEIKQLTFNFDKEELFTDKQLTNYVSANIAPKLKTLERKMQGIDKKFIKSIIQELKDPKSYSPLLLTLFSNISASLIVLASLGLISLDVIDNHLSEQKEIRNDGLYFLANLRKRCS